jgi:oxygen-independent coproporphyrinogen-3 oxidase
MDARLIRYAEETAPRYTSYPTAPHFSAEVGPETHAAWLAALPAGARLSLYLHIPFCQEICWYCGCHTVATRQDAPVIDYAGALAHEIATIAAATSARRVVSIAWGGGTPNRLPATEILRLGQDLKARFDLANVEEHAVEIDPRTVTQAHAEAFAAIGADRASLGVQDFNAHVQAAIGRAQPASVVGEAVRALKSAGIRRINFDLMYGLPRQSVADAVASARVAASLAPDRLAVFGYAHVPWFKSRQRLIDADALPGASERLAQQAAIKETLEAAGYVAIGFDHFARPNDPLAIAAREGRLTRSFQGYAIESADALLGLGSSAISTFPQGYIQNSPDLPGWARAIESGGLASARGVALSEEDRARRAIIERLVCDFAVDLGPYGGFLRFAEAIEPLAGLAVDGLVSIADERIEITPLGRPFARLAAQAFDAYRPLGLARHSRAV